MKNSLGENSFIIDYRDEHGKRKQTRTDACTLKDAQRIERSILTEIDKAKTLGLSREALSPTTFSAFAEKVYLPSIEKTVRASTYKRYEDLYNNLKAFFGQMNLASITPAAIDNYFAKAENSADAPGPGELHNRRARLGAILEMAMIRRLIQYNPIRAVKGRSYNPKKRHVITPDEEKALFKHSPSWLKPFIVIGLYGGMRESEISAMKWEDVKDNFIHIPDSKTGEPRYVPINDQIRAVLGAQDRVIIGGKPVAHVFWNASILKPFSGNSISEGFRRVARDAGVPATFHCTRSTFVTRIRDAGVNDARVMAITGHKTARMLQHYTNLGPKHLEGATDVICREIAEPVQNEAAKA
jgi:integrase